MSPKQQVPASAAGQTSGDQAAPQPATAGNASAGARHWNNRRRHVSWKPTAPDGSERPEHGIRKPLQRQNAGPSAFPAEAAPLVGAEGLDCKTASSSPRSGPKAFPAAAAPAVDSVASHTPSFSNEGDAGEGLTWWKLVGATTTVAEPGHRHLPTNVCS